MSIVRIAIDGPAGAGKSTIAKMAAKALGIDYIDTGAMYRAIALKLVRTGTDYNDPDALRAMLSTTDVDFSNGSIFLDGENADAFIRTPEISKMASVSSGVKEIRDKLASLQRAMGERKSVIMDGRDIASKIFPDAEVKIYITASSLVRAQRRAEDLSRMGIACNIEDIQKEIEERDLRDTTRENSPLVRVPEAVLVDTGSSTPEETLEEVLGIIRKAVQSNG